MKRGCWMLPEGQPPCFIILGRYGDIIQLLPAFQAVAERTGMKPIVISSTEYHQVFEGVSYVDCKPVHWSWWEGVPHARRLAQEQYGEAIVCQWWADEPFLWNPKAYQQLQDENCIVLQSHGHGWGVDMAVAPNYGTSMWTRAGFSPEEMMKLPLVFDRRDTNREQLLVRNHRGIGNKPMLLVNFTGHSSPFPPHPEVMREVNKFGGRFHIVDVGRIRADRIYDLLGLMDAAAGMITTDTATLHLAAAGNIPYIAYTVDGWCSSVPKGRVVLEIKYNEAMGRLGELPHILEAWAGGSGGPRRPQFATGGGGGIMAV